MTDTLTYTPEQEARYAEIEGDLFTELRGKYTAADRDSMAESGDAMSDGSYPIKDKEDLVKAIKAVGRGGASHDAIRKHIMARAKVLELSNLIPEDWQDDGSIKDTAEAKARSRSVEWRMKRANEMPRQERRARFEKVEIRSDDNGSLHFSGYASLTDTPYDMGWYSESIARGAFKKTLAEDPDVVLNINHGTGGSGLPIARTKAGTLVIAEDSRGLRVEADLDPEDPDVALLARKMNRGDLDGQMSFAFRCTRQSWNEDYTDRSITELDIHRGDVSVVTQGASPTTTSSIRADDALMSLRHAGILGVSDALLELRAFAVKPKELRESEGMSSDASDVLLSILNLCAIADDAMDQAQPVLAQLLGVANPDDSDAYSNASDDTECPSCNGMNDSDASYCDQCGSAMPDDSDESDDADGEELAMPNYGAEARALIEAHRYAPRRDVA